MSQSFPGRARRQRAEMRAQRRFLARPVAPSRIRAAELSLDGVSVRFGVVQAVNEVSLSVAPGEVVGVVGANGAGKTTLIDAVTGFVASTGRVRLGDHELDECSPHQRARLGLSRSWQSLELIEDLTVLENLRIAVDRGSRGSILFDLVRPSRGAPTAAMLRAIDTFGLADDLASMPAELSTGRRKLVALARAIADEPSVLLLDEPCSGLDQDEREEVGAVVTMLARDWGMGVLLVEHDVQLVRRLSDRMVALDFGQVVAEGDPDAVLSDSRVTAAFLGQPDADDAIEPAGARDLKEADGTADVIEVIEA